MNKNTVLTISMIAVLCLAPSAAKAGTFCIAGAGLEPQCYYDDIRSCRRASDPPNTACVVSPQAYLTYAGGARYCTVDESAQAQCYYADRSECSTEADRARKLCIDRQLMHAGNDPFRYDPRIQNN